MFENLITSIENGIKLVDGLYHIKNCLSQSELNLCKELYKSPGEKVPLQEDRPRLQRIVDFDFSKITKIINKNHDKSLGHISGILWEDTEGYKLDKHVDNDNIFLSLQIYLPSTAQKRTGTIFYADKKVQVPFVPNTGYFCIIPQELTHSSGRPVRKGTYRRSLYCIGYE